jgi:fermentation-respiration switch protein FrsA (DUF1100 family)
LGKGFIIKAIFKMGIVIGSLGYVALGAFAFSYSDRLIFQPPRPTYVDTESITKIKTISGKRISAINLVSSGSKYIILYSHGNAEDLGTVIHRLKELYGLGFSIIGYDYEGYGTSDGTPSEQATYENIDAVYKYLIDDMKFPANKIIAYGFSLGGGVATDLASKRYIGGLILESTFVSAYRVLTKYSILPYDKYKSIDKIKNVKCPILIMHGDSDNVIPFWHGEKLFESAPLPKRHLWVKGAAHGDISMMNGDVYKKAIIDFTSLIGEK